MKDRKRVTVRYAPTGADKAVMLGVGVFHAIFGTVFALIGSSITASAGLIDGREHQEKREQILKEL